MYHVSDDHWCCNALSPLRFNCLMSSIAGLVFFCGWWIMIDCMAQSYRHFEGIYVLPGFFGSFGMLLVNSVPAVLVHDWSGFGRTRFQNFTIRLCLFLGFMVAFGCLIAAFYIWIECFLRHKNPQKWPGYAVLFQNLGIFTATVLLRFRRPYEWL